MDSLDINACAFQPPFVDIPGFSSDSKEKDGSPSRGARAKVKSPGPSPKRAKKRKVESDGETSDSKRINGGKHINGTNACRVENVVLL